MNLTKLGLLPLLLVSTSALATEAPKRTCSQGPAKNYNKPDKILATKRRSLYHLVFQHLRPPLVTRVGQIGKRIADTLTVCH